VKKFTFLSNHNGKEGSLPMDEKSNSRTEDILGSVMVIGGGIAGMQASLDLADSGYKVYLVEKGPAIGGVMAQLDKTFPTNDCSM
jgi:heterodisulfide reductase subunit A